MRLEWDEDKRLINWQKHDIDFADVWQVFEGESLTGLDDRFDYDETRFVTYGLLEGEVVVVAHTENDDTIRVISARKAEKYEQEEFFHKIWD